MENNTVQGERMLALIRTKFPQYHPVIAIAEMAHDEEIEDPRIKLECHKTLLKHVSPELKSVEVKADIKDHRRVTVSLFDGEDPGVNAGATIHQLPQVLPVRDDPLWAQLVLLEAVAA